MGSKHDSKGVKTMGGVKRSTSPAHRVAWTPGEMRCGHRTYTGWVPVSMLRLKPGNPVGRTDPKSRQYKTSRLMDAIVETGGPIESIVVTGQKSDPWWWVVNGNTRAKLTEDEFGPEHRVLVVLVQGKTDRVYAILNGKGASRPIAAADKPGMYLRNPDMLDTDDLNNFCAMEAVVGRDAVEEMSERGKTYYAYKAARRVAEFCGCTSDAFVRACFLWVMRTDSSRQAIVIAAGPHEKGVVKDCIIQGIPLPTCCAA